jgi:hypothetical protein
MSKQIEKIDCLLGKSGEHFSYGSVTEPARGDRSYESLVPQIAFCLHLPIETTLQIYKLHGNAHGMLDHPNIRSKNDTGIHFPD